jgi:glycosyltransferase involved in cell wall biosynthesis
MVSICILNMNRVETLKKTFEVLSGLNIEHEILVWDQNSNDGSIEFLKNQTNVKLFLSDKNVGNSISRNRMIENSKYEYVFLLDSDIVPIPNSIECLHQFMIENSEYSFIGYDFSKSTLNPDNVTPYESGIELKDVQKNIRIALTQYGMFRRRDLLKCPFPEFYPFNQEGWGAEDDLVGIAIVDGKIGLSGMIMNRVYYHNFPKSSWDYIEGEVHILYALRFIMYRYFDWFLSVEQKIETLQTNKIPTTKLDLTKYHWEFGGNFGDVATDWVWKTYFPFFELNDNSDNLLFFGGSIIDHYENVTILSNKEFKKLYMFGVGVYTPYFNLPNVDFEIYPRGHETERLIKERGFETKDVVGDVLQLLSLIPYKKSKKTDTLLIQDVFFKTPISESGYDIIRVADIIPTDEEPAEFVNMVDFLDKTVDYNSIISSQIHPFYYYVVSGKSAKLVRKEVSPGVLDVRPDDLSFKKNLRFTENEFTALESDEQNSINCRLEIQQHIPRMIESLFNLLKNFS